MSPLPDEVPVVATQPRELGAVGDDPTPPARVIRPRRSLPGSRAVVGALLVTVAAVGIFATWSRASRGPSARYVVAARSLPAGHRLVPADLRVVSMQLPAVVAQRSFSSAGAVARGITLGPLEPGELVQAGNVLPARQAEPHPELSFAIDTDRAVAGSLQPGDRIDLFATYGSGPDSSTSLVVPSAELRAVSDGASNGLNGGRRYVLTVALADREAAQALTNAVRAGELTVVRSTGFRGPPPSGPYQPAVPPKGG